MIPFWCACCTARQTSTKSASRSRVESRCVSQYSCDRQALDELHREVRPARGGGAGVVDARDARVVHQRQRLALGLEARDDLARVHAGLEDLQRHAPADRMLALGEEDRTEAALADLLQELVGADQAPGALERTFGRIGAGERIGRRAHLPAPPWYFASCSSNSVRLGPGAGSSFFKASSCVFTACAALPVAK